MRRSQSCKNLKVELVIKHKSVARIQYLNSFAIPIICQQADVVGIPDCSHQTTGAQKLAGDSTLRTGRAVSPRSETGSAVKLRRSVCAMCILDDDVHLACLAENHFVYDEPDLWR